jgi:hypothetical protein
VVYEDFVASTIWVLSRPLHRNRYRPSITPLKPNHDHSSDVIVIECGSIKWCYTPDNNSLIVRSHYASKGVGRNNRGNGLAHCVPTRCSLLVKFRRLFTSCAPTVRKVQFKNVNITCLQQKKMGQIEPHRNGIVSVLSK